jgi:hypothetical protein
MALLMVMTVCLLVYAPLEYRIRHALRAQQTTFPDQKGQPVQHPTARWVFQYFVGIHLLRLPGEGAFVLNLRDQHQQLLRILGRRYEVLYSCKYTVPCGMSAGQPQHLPGRSRALGAPERPQSMARRASWSDGSDTFQDMPNGAAGLGDGKGFRETRRAGLL